MTPAESSPFPLLFSPLQVGVITLRNRVVMLPHGTSMVVGGAPTEDDIAYYEDRARSGVGLMITGAAVTPGGADALALLEQDLAVDIVVMDLSMPDMDGATRGSAS